MPSTIAEVEPIALTLGSDVRSRWRSRARGRAQSPARPQACRVAGANNDPEDAADDAHKPDHRQLPLLLLPASHSHHRGPSGPALTDQEAGAPPVPEMSAQMLVWNRGSWAAVQPPRISLVIGNDRYGVGGQAPHSPVAPVTATGSIRIPSTAQLVYHRRQVPGSPGPNPALVPTVTRRAGWP